MSNEIKLCLKTAMLLVYRLWLIKLKSPKTEFMGRSCGFHVTHGESERAMENINPKMCGKHFWENMLVITALCSFLPLTLDFSLLAFFFFFFYGTKEPSLHPFTTLHK